MPVTILSTVSPTTDELNPCDLCEQLYREHAEASAELWALNKTIGIGAQSSVTTEHRQSDRHQKETELLKAAHERCAKTRMALMEHRRGHMT
jgi:hypothetical protein